MATKSTSKEGYQIYEPYKSTGDSALEQPDGHTFAEFRQTTKGVFEGVVPSL